MRKNTGPFSTKKYFCGSLRQDYVLSGHAPRPFILKRLFVSKHETHFNDYRLGPLFNASHQIPSMHSTKSRSVAPSSTACIDLETTETPAPGRGLSL